ncbi:MAG: L-threonylcarbamoyladenylate synthase [Candidatus Saccharibacteria bacterium]|nr:L-threonylcarbamoyladenylate synthase [Candidatus Saccharibacteria bacterium]
MNIIETLQNDGVGVLATDTVYGVVGRLLSSTAIERMYQVKHRNPQKPVGTVLIASTDQLDGIVDKKLLNRAEKYWPGPVSIVLPVSGLDYAHKGLGSLPFRIPDDERLISLLEQTGPLATSSANIESQPPATTIEQAKQYFVDAVDFYEDGGDSSDKTPSKIIKITDDGVQEIRS